MFENIIGQEKIKGLLSRAIRGGKVNHAYIIEGDEGMGKKTLAYAFSLYLVCENGSACEKCSGCMLAKAGTHPDIINVKPEDNKKSIGVDSIREIVSQATVKPCISDKKIIIISDEYELTTGAQNALLKVLEEPPAYIVFLILTRNSNHLLETVRSRSVLLRLLPYKREQVKDALVSISDADFESVYAYAGGNIGKAKKLAVDDDFVRLRREVIEVTANIASAHRSGVFNIISYMETHKEDSDVVFSIMLSLLRDAAVICLGCDNLCKNVDVIDVLKIFSAKINAGKAIKSIEKILKYKQMLDSNVNYSLLVTSFSNEIWEVLNG